MTTKKRILLVAAENGALPGGKVGGIGDVIRDLPHALAERNWQPTVLTPSYGIFNRIPGATRISDIAVRFGGEDLTATVWEMRGPDSRIRHRAIEHSLLSPNGEHSIYANDGPDRPFATDASKFAFFCAAVAAYVMDCDQKPDVVHLHDWHTGHYLALRQWLPAFASLKPIRTVFTIHNLALQGIRPLADDDSSLAHWFPELNQSEVLLADPRYHNCVNPMAIAIRLADNLNTVSPTYAQEILLTSDPALGFSGGEGLEKDLQQAVEQGRLTGILNGCEYPKTGRRPGWQQLISATKDALTKWNMANASTRHVESLHKLEQFPMKRPSSLLVSVGRLTAQKVTLFLEPTSTGKVALNAILDALGNNGVLILIGSGDPHLEERMHQVASQRKNFLFLCGYSESLADLLYQAGDLFLMPSSFEPCGISQMLAMRSGQPCVAHAVGGLKDTIKDLDNGFLFAGDTPREQADNFVATVQSALQLQNLEEEAWKTLRTHAAAERFSWDVAAAQYEECLYESAAR